MIIFTTKKMHQEAMKYAADNMKCTRFWYPPTSSEEDIKQMDAINKSSLFNRLYNRHIEYLTRKKQDLLNTLWQVPLLIIGFILFIASLVVILMPWEMYFELWSSLFH